MGNNTSVVAVDGDWSCGLAPALGNVISKLTASKQSAFVFAKPHANTPAVQALIKKKFGEVGITVTREGEISGEMIDEKGFIDQVGQHCSPHTHLPITRH